jgi:cell division septation protein DedD
MSYDFSFNTKTISFLLGGSAFVGIMLFAAGLLVGANWKTEPTAVAAVTGSPQPAAAATIAAPAAAPAPVPTEPVLKADATSTQAAAAPAEAAAPTAAPATAAPSPVKQSHSAAPAESRRALTLPPLRESDASDVRVIERADATVADDAAVRSNDSTGTNRAATNQLAFSVQVGVFVDENAANLLVRQLQGKGYTPLILTANDDESRRWYAVRIGAYANRTEAAQAASNIGTREKVKAVVRPLGSL